MTTKNSMGSKVMVKTRGAILYTRVSTGEQDKSGTSPETQRDACRQKALALGLPVVAEYYDGGVSGAFLLARPGMQAALTDIREGRADTLICANISRYSRDVEHQQAIKKAVRTAGGRLVFCDMDFDDTPEGDLNFNIQGSFAEYDRQAIKTRLAKGRWKRAGQGQQPSRSRPPLGYHIVSKAQVECGLYPAEMVGRYLIDEARASLVRELFARYASGQVGMPGLCQDLNARAVPTPRGGTLWRTSTLRAILTNPVYKGEPAYGRTLTRTDEARLTEAHRITGRPLTTARYRQEAPEGRAAILSAPALVGAGQWEDAQRRMATNRTNRGGNPRRSRMLSGRAFLPCGHSALLVPAQARSTDYYRCSATRNAEEWENKAGCDPAYYRVDVAEHAVAQAFLSAAHDPQALADARRLYARSTETAPSSHDARREMAALDKALAELAKEDVLAVQAQMAGLRMGASPDAYAALFADLAARRKDMEDRRGILARALGTQRVVKDCPQTAAGVQPDLALTALADAALVLTAPDVPGETKRDIVGMVISRVVCRCDGADVYFLPGFAPCAAAEAGEAGADGETGMDTLQTIEELWYIVRGAGRFHRLSPDGGEEQAADVALGDALLIPTGYRFWVENTGPDDLVFLCCGTPPWPGHDEAIVWENSLP